MKALKVLVVVMGVLLVAGFAVVAVTVASRLNHRAGTPAAPVATISVPNGEHRSVDLPAGAEVVTVQSDGDRVAVRLKLAEGGEELILLDWKTGARLATLDLKPGAAPAEPVPVKP